MFIAKDISFQNLFGWKIFDVYLNLCRKIKHEDIQKTILSQKYYQIKMEIDLDFFNIFFTRIPIYSNARQSAGINSPGFRL